MKIKNLNLYPLIPSVNFDPNLYQDLIIIKTDREDIIFDSNLLKSLKISKKNIEKLKTQYYEKSVLFDKMKKESDILSLRKLNKEVTKVEYKIQSLWNIKKNKNFHKWYLVPKCMCPKIDNYQTLGTKDHIINENCPIHSNNQEILNKIQLKRKMNRLFKK